MVELMKSGQPSRTAAMVAACRGFAAYLPKDAQLALDPFGLAFGGPWAERTARLLERARWLARPALAVLEPRSSVLWMQLRTRTIDDALRRFSADGGTQVVLLGAGFDCRAARMRDELPGVRFFEVDHPATQADKKRVLAELGARSDVSYLSWDFEHESMSALQARLQELGLDPSARTLTVWEGVTMYLTEPAIVATLAAVRAYSAPASLLVFTYFERAGLRTETALSHLVASVGEPFRFGWEPSELPGFLAAHGFALLSDNAMSELARVLLPARYHQKLDNRSRHVAQARIS